MIVRAEMVIDRPCDEVFALVADRLFETYHLWNTGVIEIEQLTEGPVRVGSRGVALTYIRRGRSGYHEEGCTFEVVHYLEGRELGLDESDPHPMIDRSRMMVLFDPLGARTRLRAAEQIFWGVDWTAFAQPFLWLRRKADLRRNLRRLRAALQAKALPPPPRRPR